MGVEVNEIDLTNLGVDLRREPLEVAESRLYAGQDPESGNAIVVKVYSGLQLGQILDYARTTCFLAGKVNPKRIFMALHPNGEEIKCLTHIVPVTMIGVANGLPFTVSDFVAGDTLFDIDPHYQSTNFGNSKEPLVVLSSQLRKMSGKKGIGIIPWNVKLLNQGNVNILAITDLCGSVQSL